MASKGSPPPGSRPSDHSEKKAPLAQPETSESSDDGTSTGSTEARTESTTISPSHDTASPAEPSSEAESGQSGSNLPKDGSRSGSADAAGELPELTNGSAATGRDEPVQEPEERDTAAAAENIPLNPPREPPQDRPPSENGAAELEDLMASGNAGNPAVATAPLRIDVRSMPPYYVPHPRLVDPNERTGVLGCLANFLQCWQAYSIYVSDSVFLLPFQVLLIAASISAIVMGSLYVRKCPMATELPFLIITLGTLGFVAVMLRVVLVVYVYRSQMLKFLGALRACIIFVNLLFIMIYVAEMWSFFSHTTSFDANDHAYCNPVFHTFTSILNSSLLLVLPILFILHFPAFVFNYFNVGGPGFPIEGSQ